MATIKKKHMQTITYTLKHEDGVRAARGKDLASLCKLAKKAGRSNANGWHLVSSDGIEFPDDEWDELARLC